MMPSRKIHGIKTVEMKKMYHLLYPHVRPHWPWVLGAIALSFVLAAIKTGQAYLIRPLVDHGIQPDVGFNQMLLIAGAVIALALVNFPARFCHFYWMRYILEKATCEIRSQLYRKLQRLPMGYFQQSQQGELLSALLSDTLLLSRGLEETMALVRGPLTVIGLLGLAFYRDWQLASLVVVAIPLIMLMLKKYGEKVRSSQSLTQKHIAEMTHSMSEGLQGQKVIKAFNLQEYMITRFSAIQDRSLHSIKKTVKNEELVKPMVEVVAAFALSGVLLFAHHRIASGAISPGDFISFIMAIALTIDPIRRYATAHIKFNLAQAAGNRILHVLSLPEERDQGHIDQQSFEHKIEFKRISFCYEKQPVLQDLSLEIFKGEKVALVGLSGSGKSTLIGLLARLYHVQKGAILIDGIPIEKMTLNSVRSLFGMVSQEMFLFNDTIEENITLGKKHSREELQQALKVSHCQEFVSRLPQREQTVIGDRGTRLSGGQGQRVTIARAYLRQSPILLFDEATSALDNESEKIVQQTLDEFSAQHTVIAVAHRLSTIQHFDRIAVLRDGAVVAQGTHQELMRQEGEYKKLYELSQQE